MGTSQSSKGPPGGVPMVPPWVPDATPAETPTEGNAPGGAAEPASANPAQQPSTTSVPTIAPAGRFTGARRSLGSFARTGDSAEMRRGVGRYVRSGYGGASIASGRFGGTASTAAALHGALSSVASGAPAAGSPLDPGILAGRSARQVMDAIVQAVRPPDGTQDAEASRAAIRDALSELLTKFEQADLLNLSLEQRDFVIERFVAMDVYRRFVLDLGKTIQEKALSAAAGLARLKEVKDYVKETVAATFRKLREAGRSMSSGRVKEIVRSALRETMQVFEAFAE
jgi:hypothetical protein